jgi:hypothetical protein
MRLIVLPSPSAAKIRVGPRPRPRRSRVRRGRRPDPFDRTGWEVIDKIDDASQIELFQQLRDLRPDALQRFHFRE